MSHRDRRTLVAGVGIIVGLVALSRGVPALRHWFAELAVRDEALRRHLAVLRESRRQIGPMRDSLRVRRDRLARLNAQLVTARTPNAAAAMLGALVERLADDAEIKISALELRADSSSRSGISRVGLRVSAEGDVSGLAAFLSAVEQQREPMAVRALSASASDPMNSTGTSEVLRFDVIIDGLALVPTEPAR